MVFYDLWNRFDEVFLGTLLLRMYPPILNPKSMKYIPIIIANTFSFPLTV